MSELGSFLFHLVLGAPHLGRVVASIDHRPDQGLRVSVTSYGGCMLSEVHRRLFDPWD